MSHLHPSKILDLPEGEELKKESPNLLASITDTDGCRLKDWINAKREVIRDEFESGAFIGANSEETSVRHIKEVARLDLLNEILMLTVDEMEDLLDGQGRK